MKVGTVSERPSQEIKCETFAVISKVSLLSLPCHKVAHTVKKSVFIYTLLACPHYCLSFTLYMCFIAHLRGSVIEHARVIEPIILC